MAIDYWQNLDENIIYHIYDRSISDIELFRDNKDYYGFLTKYDRYLSPYMDLFSYCLIPNHFHFLVKIKDRHSIIEHAKSEKTKRSNQLVTDECSVSSFLEDQMRRYLSSVSIRYNNKYERYGTLLTERFKRVSVSSETKLMYLICYIHHNPVHHDIVKAYDDWEHSSFHDYLIEKNSRVSTSIIVEWFGGVDAFLEAHEEFRLLKREGLNIDL